jgi:hypothetical protein
MLVAVIDQCQASDFASALPAGWSCAASSAGSASAASTAAAKVATLLLMGSSSIA